ncbi:MAG: phage major tail tube protein [Butyrivibrio sp.]|nr:phage major tail tube protein [Butyrivibrio sp.]
MEKMTAILADRVYCDGSLALEDAEVTLPTIEAQTFEVKAMGPINVVLPGLFESMEMTIKATGVTKEYARISGFSSHKFTITAAQNQVAADGTITPKQFKAIVTGISKKIGEIGVNPGDAAEPESSYEVTRYEAYEDGVQLWVIDKLNNICKVWNGSDYTDFGSQIATLLDA